MKLFVGLGNPGTKYARNRHNIGFMAVDGIIRRHSFSPERQKFQALMCDGLMGGEKVVALKPQTYMNESGQSVGEAMRFFKLEPKDVIVFYDELDLAPGKIRVKLGGGAAGHNGIRSITQHIGADFIRVRLGIGHPGDRARVHSHVLSDFAKADQDWLDKLLDAVAAEAPLLAEGKDATFANKVHLALNPPRAPKAAPGEGEPKTKE